MKILLVADGRSPITRGWIAAIRPLGFQVSLISTFPCQPIDQVTLERVLPVAFGSLAGSQVDRVARPDEKSRSRLANLRPLLLQLRYHLGPLTLPFYSSRFREIINKVTPDLVHALRIPFEGILAAHLPDGTPLLLSTWGNDLTLHAKGSRLMAWQTHRALARADGLFSDTQRDIRLAREWGLKADRPAITIPGNGGVDLVELQHLLKKSAIQPDFLNNRYPVIINPRGFRPGSVHQDVFFQSLPAVIRELPHAIFICTGMQGQDEANRQVHALGMEKNVVLLPYLHQAELWNLFRQSQVYVSLSSHDGTPNTLLEAMALGCLPVCGDIESIREWITDGQNGLLVNPLDSQSASQAILQACRDSALQVKARTQNLEIIRARADVQANRKVIKAFYQKFYKEK
jgi:glycosyltransferase involved in cell wall biosynthesis